MAKELLKEAIADAKAVREVAMQNAKLALEEAFNSKIQSMLAAKLNEELDEEELEEEVEEDYNTAMEEESYMEDEQEMEEAMEYDEDDPMEEMYGRSYEEDDDSEKKKETMEEDSIEEEINLDEILASLEEEMKEGMYSYEEDSIEEEEKEDPKEGMYSYEEDSLEEEIDLDALMEDLIEEETIEEEAVEEAVTDMVIQAAKMLGTSTDAVEAMAAAITGLGVVGLAGGKDLAKMLLDKGEEGAKKAFSKLKSAVGKEATNEVSEESLNEAYSTIETLRTQLSEVNLLNAKLLYVNKLFKANNLTEAQKLKVVETLDEATNVKEAKLVFNTLRESFESTGLKKNISEGLKGFASKATGTPAKKEVLTEQADETVARFQKLANIKF